MTQIYYSYISKDIHDLLMNEHLPKFSNAFSNKLLSFRRWQDAQLSLLGRLLLKYSFESNNIPFDEKNLIFSNYDKPFLKDHPFKFNISHSGEITICVISDFTEVGIDIELIKEIDIEDFKPQMTKKEWNDMNNSDSTKHAFFEYWTQKEAVLKANGKGFSILLNSFEIAVNNSSKINDDYFYLENIYVEKNYKCHVAFKNKLCQEKLSLEKVAF